MRRKMLCQGRLDSGRYTGSHIRFDGKLSNGKEYKRMLAKFWKGDEARKALGDWAPVETLTHGADGGLAEFCRRFVDMFTKK